MGGQFTGFFANRTEEMAFGFLFLLLPWLWMVLSVHGRLYGEGVSRQQVSWFPGCSAPELTRLGAAWAWVGRIVVCAYVVHAMSIAADISNTLLGLCFGAMICFMVRVAWRTWGQLQTRRKRNAILHISLTLIFSIIGGIVFEIAVTNKNLPAEQSRAYSGMNGACVVLRSFDLHDLWHWLSAIALGCYALFVLDLAQGPRDVQRLTFVASQMELSETA